MRSLSAAAIHIADLSVAELNEAFAARRLTPIDAADAALERICDFDRHVNAFVHVDPATTRRMAEASTARWQAGAPLGPLDGIPISIKDLAPVAGWPLRRGSSALRDDPPSPADSPPVARLREGGAVFIGKTATPEHGLRIVCRSDVHGVTRNPYSLDRTPGGSSGGAAAALALGMGTLALGTDGAGSIRIPAAFCNLVGLKPGFGRVPSYPPSFFMPHSVTGPMGRRVADVAAMTGVISGCEPRDPFAWPIPFDAAKMDEKRYEGMRVALSVTLGTGIQPEHATAQALEHAARALERRGAVIEVVEPTWPVDPLKPFLVFWHATYAGFLDTFPPARAAHMGELMHRIAALGRGIEIVTYHRALAERLAITDVAHQFLQTYAAMLAPVMPCHAFDVDAEAPPGQNPDDWRWCPYTYIANMTGQPAVAVPAGFSADGLPIGVQLVGARGSEESLLTFAAMIEGELDLVGRRPPILGRSTLETPGMRRPSSQSQ